MANLKQCCNKDSRPLGRRGRTLAYLGLLSFVSAAASGRIEAQGVKISALPDATSAGLTDMIPCVQGDTTRRCTPAEFLALLTGGVGIGISGQTISTASNEADFLISGALTCGASTQGKVQVHSTTPLQYCDNAGTPTLRYAAYGNAAGECLSVADNSIALGTKTTGGYAASVSEAGPATTASAAVSDPANCSAGSVAGGIDASWIAQDCLDPITETELDSLAELNTQLSTTIADGPHTVDTDDQTAAEVVYVPVDGTDWTDPDPDDVADGLDKLVDRLATEEAKADDDIPEDADLGSGTPSASTWLRGDRTWSSLPADDDVPESGDFGALALTGPVTSSGVVTSIADDAVELGVKTTGFYAGSDSEGGYALSGDSATNFFVSGTMNTARLGSGGADSTKYLRGDSTWQVVPIGNAFETYTGLAGADVVADSSTDTLTFDCAAGVACEGNATTDTLILTTNSVAPHFLFNGGALSLTCSDFGMMQVMNDGSLEYCDGATALRTGFLDADGVDDDLPDADEIVESMLKAVDAASDEECLTFEVTTGDFEWQACGSGGGTPGGSDTQVQFNDGGAFGGDAGLVYNKTTDTLTASGPILVSDGTKTAPALSFKNDTNSGLYERTADRITVSLGAVAEFEFQTTGFVAASNNGIGFASDVVDVGGGDAYFSRLASGSIGVGTTVGSSNGKITLNTTTTDLARLVPSASPPVTCGDANTQGTIYNDSSVALCWCDGTAWQKLSGGGTCA